MRLDVYALSNVGLKRAENQDNYYCNGICADTTDNDYRYSNSISTKKPSLFGVFDGMGGHVHGERASQIAVNEAKKQFRLYRRGEQEQLLNQICFSANERICEEMRNTVKGRMGSTASMVLFDKEKYYNCNLGDSPIFLVRDNKIRMISEEHTERKNYEEVFGKQYDPKRKFKLTQHLGIFSDEMQIAPYLDFGDLIPDDVFILCSDGLTDMVSQADILSIVKSNKDIKSVAENLLSSALSNGGKDNVTIIICKASSKKRNICFLR